MSWRPTFFLSNRRYCHDIGAERKSQSVIVTVAKINTVGCEPTRKHTAPRSYKSKRSIYLHRYEVQDTKCQNLIRNVQNLANNSKLLLQFHLQLHSEFHVSINKIFCYTGSMVTKREYNISFCKRKRQIALQRDF